MLLLGLLLGCASRPPLAMSLPETDGPVTNTAVGERPVVGTHAEEENRSEINASGQQMYNSERTPDGSPSPAPITPNTGIP